MNKAFEPPQIEVAGVLILIVGVVISVTVTVMLLLVAVALEGQVALLVSTQLVISPVTPIS